jgi:POT family proton-dependent oligopeptide transporter
MAAEKFMLCPGAALDLAGRSGVSLRPMQGTPAPASGHPRGLYTLFFTEMWERLSYYGMRALLVLFMVDQVQHGGLGLDDKTATAIYGLYTAGVYLAALPGGWIADRLLGAQRAVWLGGILIAVGHFLLAVPSASFFFAGLLFVVAGTGLLKPNISALVGALYPEGGARRDAGFTVFYMGINVGAALGPLVCSALGEKLNWHYGFTAAGLGMALGLVQFRLTRHHLGAAGAPPADRGAATRRDWTLLWTALGVGAVVTVLAFAGILKLNPVWLAQNTTVVLVGLAAAYFLWAFLFAGLTATEKGRLAVIVLLFVSAALFWAGYEQAGSSLNLFAKRHTERLIGAFNWTIPTGWFQILPAVFVIAFAPVAAAVWLALGRRGRNPSLAVKMSLGLLLLAAGFIVVALAAKRALAQGPVWPSWLVLTYLLHVLGELCVSPVGLSSVTKLAPPRLVGQMMGIWFLAASVGNLIAGLFAGEVTGDNTAAMSAKFLQVVGVVGVTGVLLLLLNKPVKRWMGGVE